MADQQHCLVLDVGKTNVKIHILNKALESLVTHHLDNKVLDSTPYPHPDIAGLWDWMLEVFTSVSRDFHINAIAVSTHGATAALVDPDNQADGLVLPVLDYEWQGVEEADDYLSLRPPYTETYSPNLPAGLNLGRQIYWQQKNFPDYFSNTRAILLYPQYWAWRLSGEMVSEVTSLGCHTDLWSPTNSCFSSLTESRGWSRLFPHLVPAWDAIGTISSEISDITGLPGSCRVHAGIHDSNASFMRYKLAMPDSEFCVVSTGTWVVCMSNSHTVDMLDEQKDMLANSDVHGDVVPCIRFMGGREYAGICRLCGAETDEEIYIDDITEIIDNGIFALPDFSGGSGPFGFRKPEIRGKPGKGNALASLYCALMVDYCLDLLQVESDVIITGSFLQNPLLCSLIAQLRQQKVFISSDTAGTVRGTAQLTDWNCPVSVSLTPCEAAQLKGLGEYTGKWRALAENQS